MFNSRDCRNEKCHSQNLCADCIDLQEARAYSASMNEFRKKYNSELGIYHSYNVGQPNYEQEQVVKQSVHVIEEKNHVSEVKRSINPVDLFPQSIKNPESAKIGIEPIIANKPSNFAKGRVDTIRREFFQRHDQAFLDDGNLFCGLYRPKTEVRNDWTMQQILTHAQNKSNRSRKICFDMGLMDEKGVLTDRGKNILDFDMEIYAPQRILR